MCDEKDVLKSHAVRNELNVLTVKAQDPDMIPIPLPAGHVRPRAHEQLTIFGLGHSVERSYLDKEVRHP